MLNKGFVAHVREGEEAFAKKRESAVVTAALGHCKSQQSAMVLDASPVVGIYRRAKKRITPASVRVVFFPKSAKNRKLTQHFLARVSIGTDLFSDPGQTRRCCRFGPRRRSDTLSAQNERTNDAEQSPSPPPFCLFGGDRARTSSAAPGEPKGENVCACVEKSPLFLLPLTSLPGAAAPSLLSSSSAAAAATGPLKAPPPPLWRRPRAVRPSVPPPVAGGWRGAEGERRRKTHGNGRKGMVVEVVLPLLPQQPPPPLFLGSLLFWHQRSNHSTIQARKGGENSAAASSQQQTNKRARKGQGGEAWVLPSPMIRWCYSV